ncbi:MAG: mechanosensitive ion channel [Gemmatimonadetes bacterium]|nr:mechanosensitive ion channel [Gemmatimonadota bacterium]
MLQIQAPADTTGVAALDAALNWLGAHPVTGTVLGVVAVLLVAYLADVVTRRRVLKLVSLLIKRSQYDWDDVLQEHRVFERLSHVIPGIVMYFGVQLVPGLAADVETFVQRLAAAFIVAVVALTIGAFLSATNDIYRQFEISKSRPIKGYLQVIKIVVYVLGTVVVVATLMDQNPLIFVSGIGAMTAVLMLVFKDTILSLVASVQIASNDMVRLGDWVEMPKLNADGDVIDIALHTVKIRNFDNTITTVPTSKFIDESFKNWRGMSESGARRIKRSIYIDKSTIRFLTDEEVNRFKRFKLLEDYVEKKQEEIRAFNESLGGSGEDVNWRRMTNIGTLRAYIVNYLRNHPKIDQSRTLLVRQLAPTPHGLPIELYVFCNDTRWVAYEGVQADIFDHIIALLPEFGLRLFQHPTGADWIASREQGAGLKEDRSPLSAPRSLRR